MIGPGNDRSGSIARERCQTLSRTADPASAAAARSTSTAAEPSRRESATSAGGKMEASACLIVSFASSPTPPTSLPTRRRSTRGVALGHHDDRCSFETALAHFQLTTDPALEEIGRIVHGADLAEDTFDVPTAQA